MANTMQISKDELEELKEAFAKVGKSHRGGHLAPVCCTFELDLSHPCDEQQCQQDVDILLLSWLSLCQGVPWQLCCFWLVTLAKEHRGRDLAVWLSGSTGRSLVLLLQGGLCCFLIAEVSTKQVLHCLGLGSTSGLAQCLVLVVLIQQIG